MSNHVSRAEDGVQGEFFRLLDCGGLGRVGGDEDRCVIGGHEIGLVWPFHVLNPPVGTWEYQ